MNRALAMIFVLLTAGCLSPAEAEPATSVPLVPPGAANKTHAPPTVVAGFADNVTTRGDSINYTVATTGPVTVTLRLNGTTHETATIDANRTWTLPLPFGRTPFEATFVAPGLQRIETATLTRLGVTKLTVDYGAFHPSSQGSPRSDLHTVWIDVSDRPSAPMYAQQNAKNLDAFTAHDQLVLFEKLFGKKVEYGWNANFRQYGVNRIDGAGNPFSSSAPPWWCYTVNGRSADGISIQRVQPNDAVVWRLGTCS